MLNAVWETPLSQSTTHYSAALPAEHFLSPVLLRGTFYRIVSVIQHLSSDSFRENYLRQNNLRVIEHTKRSRMLHDSALYKFTIDIDIEMSLQSSDAWSILGHHKYLTGDMQGAKSCYERTLSFTADAADMHSIYLRLGSIYLQEGQVRGC